MRGKEWEIVIITVVVLHPNLTILGHRLNVQGDPEVSEHILFVGLCYCMATAKPMAVNLI